MSIQEGSFRLTSEHLWSADSAFTEGNGTQVTGKGTQFTTDSLCLNLVKLGGQPKYNPSCFLVSIPEANSYTKLRIHLLNMFARKSVSPFLGVTHQKKGLLKSKCKLCLQSETLQTNMAFEKQIGCPLYISCMTEAEKKSDSLHSRIKVERISEHIGH